MGKYDHLTREELIKRLEQAEQYESARLYDRLDGERRIAQALVLMLQNNNNNYEEDIMRIVLERYQADRAFLFKFEWEKGTNSNIFEVYSEGITPEIDHLQNLPNEALGPYLEQFRQGFPLIVNDIEELPDTIYQGPYHLKQVFRNLQLKSAILFPMHIFGELWGYVGMETVRYYQSWNEDDIEWLKAFTNILSIGVSQRFIRTQADHNEQKFSELFQNMPIGYIHHRIIYDDFDQPIDYEFLEANPAFERLTGLKKEECIGKTAKQVSGQLNEELFQKYVEVAKSGIPIQLNYSTPLLNKWFYSALYSPRKDEFISLFYDITEQIKNTEQIRQNEKNLRTIFDNLPIGTITFDENKKYLSANSEACRIFGIANKGKYSNNLNLSPEQEDLLKEDRHLEYDLIYDPASCQVLSEEEDLPETALFVTTKILMYTDSKKRCKGYLLIAADNTKIHRVNRRLAKAEKALTENLVRLSLILETGDIYPWYFDPASGILEISNDFYKFFGIHRDTDKTYTIQKFMERIHPDDLKTFREKFENLQNEAIQRMSVELRLNINKKGFIWCEMTAGVRSKDKEQNFSQWLGFLTIIQKRKDDEAQLVEARKKAEESDKLKSAFLANVSHEIRTPLNAIVGFSELIADADTKEDKNYYLDIVKTNNYLLLNLINDILDLSKIESGRIDLKETVVDVAELCREICHVHQLKAQAGVRVIFDNSCSPFLLLTDRNRLNQLYSNLINNAVKNTTAGSITVGYKLQGKQVEFFVRDTGKGIPKEKQHIIFNRFEKLNSNIQGFGLGLSICKSILEKMNGSISLTSEEGKGSVFRFTLPYKTPIRPEQTLPESDVLPKTLSATATILIAEDIDYNYELLETILGEKYKLVRAQNGIEAINLFSTENPALILIDMQIPELTATETVQIIRELDPELPIIAMAAFAQSSEKDIALESGCNELITKPINKDKIISVIAEYLTENHIKTNQ